MKKCVIALISKYSTILILFALFLPSSIKSQSSADFYFQTGDSLARQKSFFEAFENFNKAIIIYQNNNDWDKANECVVEALFCLQKQDKFQEIITYTDSILPLLKIHNQYSTFAYAKSLAYRGRTFSRFREYPNALKNYLEAINIFEEINTNDYILSFSYRNAAQIYLRRLDYDKAINFFNKALQSDSLKHLATSIHQHLAYTYILLDNFEEALNNYNLIEEKDLSPLLLARISITGAIASKATQNYKKAIDYLNVANDAIKKLKNNDELNAIINFEFASIYLKLKNQSKTKEHLRNSIFYIHKAYSKKDREASKLYVGIGEYYFSQNNLDSALSHYQQALIQVFPNFNSTNIADNPPAEDIYTESWIMTASARKAEALRARYDLTKNIADLKNAAECFDLSLAGIRALTNSYGTDNAKLYLGDYTHNYFEEAIEVNYLLWQVTGDHQYLEKIFSIIERSKANVLAEAIQKNRALILAGIPDSLLELEQNLRLELADLNKSIKLEELYESEADTEWISDLHSRMTSQQRAYEELLANLKSDYPQFKSYVEEPVTPTIKEVQQYLNQRGETMLEYFEGSKHIYLMQITGKSSSIQQIPHSDFWDDQIGDFQDYFRNNSAIINDPTGFFSVAENLYQQVFPSDSLGEKLIIVPDGALNFIPFEALVKEQPGEPVFSKAVFLLFQHQIRYAYSAGLLISPTVHLKSDKNYLRISPLFANGERGLAPLLTGKEPIAAVPHLQTLQGNAATLSAFRGQVAHCQLLQLSTHAGADENDFAPRIEFIDQPLYLPELYAMKIPAELVVLSACETGLGKFEKGEGVMSLARGFAYAGAKDLVASLWKVNESSTSDLMQHFYANLKVGRTKSAALREAKLQYLKEAKSDVKLSPYYWAGFVSIGHDLPMDLDQKSNPWWLLLLIAMVVTIFSYWKKRPGKWSFGRTPPRH